MWPEENLRPEGRGMLGWGSAEVRSYFWGLRSSGLGELQIVPKTPVANGANFP